MKLEKRGGTNFETKMDMTPLIDCIFQLILFLVLTSQINIQAEDVELPFALEGKEPEKLKEPVAPLLLNVVRRTHPPQGEERSGDIVFNGKRLGNDQKKLAMELKREVDWDAAPPPGGRGRGLEPGPGGRGLSKLTVLVRADRVVRSEYIRTIFMACQEVGIYRIRVSSTSPQ